MLIVDTVTDTRMHNSGTRAAKQKLYDQKRKSKSWQREAEISVDGTQGAWATAL